MNARARRCACILALVLMTAGLGQSAQALHPPAAGSSIDIALGMIHVRIDRQVDEAGGQVLAVSLAVRSPLIRVPVIEIRRAIALP
jgi:hypothetical protein